MKDKQRIFDNSREVIKVLTDTAEIDREIESFNNELTTRYEQTKKNLKNLIDIRNFRNDQAMKLNVFKDRIRKSESKMSDWDEQIWMLLVRNVRINSDKLIHFKIIDSISIG